MPIDKLGQFEERTTVYHCLKELYIELLQSKSAITESEKFQLQELLIKDIHEHPTFYHAES